jgi:hypothetical protein
MEYPRLERAMILLALVASVAILVLAGSQSAAERVSRVAPPRPLATSAGS